MAGLALHVAGEQKNAARPALPRSDHARYQSDPRESRSLRRRLEAPRSWPARRIADRARRKAPGGDRGASARAGAPQRRLEADRRGDGAQGYGRGRGFPRRGRRGESENAATRGGGAGGGGGARIGAGRDPEPSGRRYAGRQGRERQCRASPLGRAAGARRHEQAARAFRDRRGARPHGFRDRREAVGRPLRGAEGCAGAARAGARAVHARPAHDRARLHRSLAAGAGARRGDVRHGAAAEV